MLRKLAKIGNSRGVILDKTLLGLLSIESDDDIMLTVENKRLIIEKAPPLAQALPRRAFTGDLRGVPDEALPSRRDLRASERLASKAMRRPKLKNTIR